MSEGPRSPRFLADIVAQPAELRGLALRLADGPARAALDEAAALLARAPFVAVAGIGASYGVSLLFHARLSGAGRAAAVYDASDLLHFGTLPAGAVAVLVSRSGRSVELVALGERLAATGVPVILITNDARSPLADAARVVLDTAVGADFLLSVKSCSAAMLLAALLGEALVGGSVGAAVPPLVAALDTAERALQDDWMPAIETAAARIAAAGSHYFLARGGGMAAALSARLLWEEAAKSPATAITTGAFRHGSQEMLSRASFLCAWLDPVLLREQDLATLTAARRMGVATMIVGHGVPADVADCVLALPAVAAPFAPILGILPGQIAAHRFAVARGVDGDMFRLCGSVVESEQGLGPGDAG